MLSKIVMVICIVMANAKDSSFYYVEYDSMKECLEGFDRIAANPKGPEVEHIYITCSNKLILKDESEIVTSDVKQVH